MVFFLATAAILATPVPVERAAWSPARPFATWASNRNAPVVLTGSIATTWAAMSTWTPSALAARGEARLLPIGCVYSSSRSKTMGPYWAEHRPLAQLPSVLSRRRASSAYNDTARASWRSFFEGSARGEHQYLSAEVHRMDREGGGGETISPSLESELTPHDEMLSLDRSKTSINVWAGARGLRTPCHYDAYHNFLVMVHGRKRIDLWPPALHHYPSLHPHHAQCLFPTAVPREDEDEDAATRNNEACAAAAGLDSECAAAARAPSAPVYSVELIEGEVLYLPPLWSHDVVVTSAFAVSVNFWTATSQTALAARLWKHAPPPPPHAVLAAAYVAHGAEERDAPAPASASASASPAEAAAAAAAAAAWPVRSIWTASFLHLALDGMELEEESPRAFVQSLYEIRFAPLIASGELAAASDPNAAVCGRYEMKAAASAITNVNAAGVGEAALALLRAEAAAAGRSARALPAGGERKVWVANWLEMRSATTVGVAATGAWLSCFGEWLDVAAQAGLIDSSY